MEPSQAVCFAAAFIAIVTVVIVVGVSYHAHQTAEWQKAFSRLADHYGGRVERGAGFSPWPRVEFPYRGHRVLVDMYSTGGKHPVYFTQFRTTWPDQRTRCEVFPDSLMTRIGKFFGMQDIEIGSPRFDADYIIHGSDVGDVRRLLTPGVQSAIGRLRRFGYNVDIYVNVCQGVLLVKKRGKFPRPRDLLAFTAYSLELFDEALKTLVDPAAGIEFVESAEKEPANLEASICQICGEPIEGGIVYCRACRTPHHHDCWEYYGACSTYGCNCREFVAPRKEAPKERRAAQPRVRRK
jgi:hypothetical protein